MAKLFMRLYRAGLLRGRGGRGGGSSLARPAGEITLLEIVEAADRPVKNCYQGLGFPGTLAEDERYRKVFQQVADRERRELARVTLADLAAEKGAVNLSQPARPWGLTPTARYFGCHHHVAAA